MRAVEDRREGATVEGVLWISDIDRWGHVHVDVQDGDRLVDVIVASIEVLDARGPAVVPRDGVRVADIADADAKGVLLPPVERVDATWEQLEAELAKRAQPLVDAGWEVTGTDRDESWQYGDSVFLGLRRGDVRIELEYYDHGQLVAYPVAAAGEELDDDSADAYFSIYDSTDAAARGEFEAQGWLARGKS